MSHEKNDSTNGKPTRVDVGVWTLYGVCALTVVIGLAYQYLTHAFDHAHFGVERIPGFYAIYGFAAFVFIVYVGKLLRVLVKRPESYYDPPPPRPKK